MCYVSRVVRLGYEYANAVAIELKAAIAEPSWFEAYRSARLLQRLIQGHVGGIEQVLSQRLTDEGKQTILEFDRWVTDNKRLLGLSSALVESVRDRQQGTPGQQLESLLELLGQSAYEAVDLVFRIEAMTGDLSEELGHTLRQLDAEGN